jgi:threonine dehydrogenase-like Zn-dependent dehydrogenase
MKTTAVRLYGEKDLRLDSFELPELKEDEMLVKIISDSVCMSTYKLVQQGDKHKRVSESLSEHPAIIGHELSGIIVEVGEKWKDRYQKGMKFTVQPEVTVDGVSRTVGYNYETYGGDSTYSILPAEVIETGSLIPFKGESYFEASLSEPTSCIIAGYRRMYHTSKTNHQHIMGIKEGGNQIILGACGPMGLECIDYALQIENGAKRIVAVDVSDERIQRAKKMLKVTDDSKELIFVNSSGLENPVEELRKLTGGHGYDDVFVYAPVRALIEQADALLAEDGCLNFFAGPVDQTLSATVNFYNVHYARTHTVGFTGSTNDDLYEALRLMEEGRIHPTVMVTHIGGLESAVDTTLKVPEIPGGKKLIYPHIDLPLTAIEDFRKLGENHRLFKYLADSCDKHQGCWNAEAERILLEHYQVDLTK